MLTELKHNQVHMFDAKHKLVLPTTYGWRVLRGVLACLAGCCV